MHQINEIINEMLEDSKGVALKALVVRFHDNTKYVFHSAPDAHAELATLLKAGGEPVGVIEVVRDAASDWVFLTRPLRQYAQVTSANHCLHALSDSLLSVLKETLGQTVKCGTRQLNTNAQELMAGKSKTKTKEISQHEVRFFRALQPGRYKTVAELAEVAQINVRTARQHAKKFVRLGIAEVAEVFPAYKYRLSDDSSKCDTDYVCRLQKATAVFDAAE